MTDFTAFLHSMVKSLTWVNLKIPPFNHVFDLLSPSNRDFDSNSASSLALHFPVTLD